MLTLLAALVLERQREITDTLADLLISTVHRIGARAERKVTQELAVEFRKVAGKETLLFRLAEAAIARPDATVRAVVYPVAGEKTLRDLVAEYKSSGPAYRRTVQTTLWGPWMRIARSSWLVSRSRSPRIIDSLNWCRTSSFCGRWCSAVSVASQLTTLLTSLMPTLPICRSGNCPGWSFHSASRASPTLGSRSSGSYRLACSSRLARPGCRSRTT
jgi:hypothetical protein